MINPPCLLGVGLDLLLEELREAAGGAAVHEAAEVLGAGLLLGRIVIRLALEHALESRIECVDVPDGLGSAASDLRKKRPLVAARPLVLAHRG